jgi:hypothetical protein
MPNKIELKTLASILNSTFPIDNADKTRLLSEVNTQMNESQGKVEKQFSRQSLQNSEAFQLFTLRPFLCHNSMSS